MKALQALLISSIVVTTGCASIVKGTDQAMTINTSGCEELGRHYCEVNTSEGVQNITAPAPINIDKSRKDITIFCATRKRDAEGTLVVESTYEAMNAGNLLIGGIIGVGVDAATGAMWKYPKAVTVPMTCEGQRSAGRMGVEQVGTK